MLLIEPTYAIELTSVGLLGGCWLCRRTLTLVSQNHKEMLQVQQIPAQADDLNTRVVTDVHAHSTRVMEINDELTSQGAPNSVLATVAKLIAVNQHMEHRHAEAKSKLQNQSKAMETHVVEARTDALTRLPNRRAFDEELGRRVAEFQRYGIPFSRLPCQPPIRIMFSTTIVTRSRCSSRSPTHNLMEDPWNPRYFGPTHI